MLSVKKKKVRRQIFSWKEGFEFRWAHNPIPSQTIWNLIRIRSKYYRWISCMNFLQVCEIYQGFKNFLDGSRPTSPKKIKSSNPFI